MKLFKNTLKSLTATVAVISLSASMIAITASATPNGNVTYQHGEAPANKQTFGKIISTEVEASMEIYGKAYYSSGVNKGKTINSLPSGGTNTKVESLYINHGSTSGSSFFEYYVNGVKEHESTAWWDFDFT